MTITLYAPQPMPHERVRPVAGLLVMALHVGLLWAVIWYGPLQVVLRGEGATTAHSASAGGLDLNAHSQPISNLNRQRFGRSEAMLGSAAAQFEASAPLTATVQAALPIAAPAAGLLAPPAAPPAATVGTLLTTLPISLTATPRLIYRPPLALPERRLTQWAADPARTQPRDPAAVDSGGAGNIDCLKDATESAIQGLQAMGPLLKRAVEKKCRQKYE